MLSYNRGVPANLTPVYRQAEAKLRVARTLEEKRAALEEMLATIPKHKGTEKLQADIKRRMARLRQEAERGSSAKKHVIHVDPEGAAQVMLLGSPNSGKSSLLGALTRAEPGIAEYPFTTTRPQPGMMQFEDVQVQLVDLPPISAEHMDPWLPNVVQGADGALLVVDPSAPGVLEAVDVVCDRLDGIHIPLVGSLPEAGDPKDTPLPTVLVANKSDLVDEGDIEVLEELFGDRFPVVRFSSRGRPHIQELKVAVWRMLGLVRIYTKKPGRKAERSAPFVLPQGSTIVDVAGRIHGDLAEKLNYARVWSQKVDGQRVGRDFELQDRDLVELAT